MRFAESDALTMAWRELVDLRSDAAVVVVALGSACGLPLYLGYLAAAQRLIPSHIGAWTLEVTLAQVFVASTTALQGLALEREQGSLVPLLLTPASDLALFLGKVLPSILLSVAQAAVALLLFAGVLAMGNPAMLPRLDPSALLVTVSGTVSAAMMCAGIGVSVGSRLRSSRAIALALTLISLGVVSLESTLGLWTLFDPIGRALALDVAITQPALGLATLFVSATLYQRSKLVKRLWR
jgi:ABC-type Na+ efflux pump permease subunit